MNLLLHSRPRAKNLLVTAVCLLVLLPLLIWMHRAVPVSVSRKAQMSGFSEPLRLFWDARPYARGINSYLHGESPYPLDEPWNILPFAYPPAFLWVGGALARLLTPAVGWKAYTVWSVASLAGLVLTLSVVFFTRLRRVEAWALLCFAPLCLLMTTVFWSGNIHTVWYCAALLAAIPGVRRNRWFAYYAIAFLATVNQPIFALLLLVPLFAGVRQWMSSVLDLLLAAAAYLAEWAVNPMLYRAFQASVTQHLQASHDFGDGLFNLGAALLMDRVPHGLALAMGLQMVFSAAVILLLWRQRARLQEEPLVCWGLVAIAVALANPRLMPYDAVIGLIPASFFLVSGLDWPWRPRMARRWLLILVAVGTSLAAHHQLGFTLWLLCGFAAGVRHLLVMQQRRPMDELVPDGPDAVFEQA